MSTAAFVGWKSVAFSTFFLPPLRPVAEGAALSTPRIPLSLSPSLRALAKQSIFAARENMDCFVRARNDGWGRDLTS